MKDESWREQVENVLYFLAACIEEGRIHDVIKTVHSAFRDNKPTDS